MGSLAWKTRPPRRRSGSYRDPDLSDRWLREARWRAERGWPNLGLRDARRIILRLVTEVERINRETGR